MNNCLPYIALCLLGTVHAWSQQPDSASVFPEPPPLRAENAWPKPKSAVLWGIIPGGGQVYNRDWWKLPLVYGGLGALTYVFVDNRAEYRRLRDNYVLLVDGDPTTNPTEAPYNQIDPISMKRYRDQWRRYSEMSGLFLGLGYLFSIGEAYVDAQLKDFDVSDRLSFRAKALSPAPGAAPAVGIGITWHLNRARPSVVTAGP
jgi:hypothetical protein